MAETTKQDLLRQLPQVGQLLERTALRALVKEYSHEYLKYCCAKVIDHYRQKLLEGAIADVNSDSIIKDIEYKATELLQPSLKKIINATGILLHTGLGRAPLLQEAYQAAFERVRSACSLELDLPSGKRGDRQSLLEELLHIVTGAENAAVVNNNAAAVMLALNTLAYRKETIVARGQLIEIGGSFRLPAVMQKSGTKLVEVGTTNRTYLKDYQEAINPRTRAILVAHSSNYRVQGFVHEEEIEKLAALCRAEKINFIHDLGGGVLIDLEHWDLPHEPVVQESVKAGAQVITFSGDKILGGPQAGILVGEKEAIDRIRKNPMMRALRPDKFTLALLEETLKLYLSPSKLIENHTVIARLTEKNDAIQARAQRIYQKVTEAKIPAGIQIRVVDSRAQLGSGALPLETFPSAAISIRVKGMKAADLARRFRLCDPPVVGYLNKENLVFDLKAVMDDEIDLLTRTILDVFLRIN